MLTRQLSFFQLSMCGEISPKKFAEKSQTNFSQTCSVPEIRTGWSKSNQAHFLQAQKLIFIISKAFLIFCNIKRMQAIDFANLFLVVRWQLINKQLVEWHFARQTLLASSDSFPNDSLPRFHHHMIALLEEELLAHCQSANCRWADAGAPLFFLQAFPSFHAKNLNESQKQT